MITENFQIRLNAREALKERWDIAVGTMFVYFVLTIAISLIPDVSYIISIIVSGPLILGLTIFSMALSRKEYAETKQIFSGFYNFANALGTYLLIVIFVILWMLLLIIPGIIYAIAYSQAFYIIADEPKTDPLVAIRKSKEMMYGYKMKYFLLQLSFIGWVLLCILTFGIGFLWLTPYIQVSNAIFYDDLKANHHARFEESIPAEAITE